MHNVTLCCIITPAYYGTLESILSHLKKVLAWLLALLKQALRTYLQLLMIIVPVLVATKLLVDWGAVDFLSRLLAPLMKVVGLPGSSSLALASGMFVNLYTGVLLLVSMPDIAGLSVAQVTILGTMMLVAHALPLELGITRKAGPRLASLFLLRAGGAFLLGWLLNKFYTLTAWLQEPVAIVWNPAPADSSWGTWALSQLQTLAAMFFIIFGLMALLRILDLLKITALITRLLKPLLTLLGISEKAAPLTILGRIMGIVIGGGLIIQEARSGKISDRDVYASMALMSLSHSLIEDTLVVSIIGAHSSGLLWARLTFTLILIFPLVQLVKRLPDRLFEKYLFHSQKRSTAAQ